MSRSIIHSIRDECARYKALAEAAMEQLDEPALSAAGPGGNSIAVICWHVSGNLRSRFTDFLTTDGEKPWRKRDEEFVPRTVTRAELLAKWEEGWRALFAALAGLGDEQLHATVTIRGESFEVHEALHRALAHLGYHAGQIVHIARTRAGARWRYLSIPPGQSETYNQSPAMERPAAHAGALARAGQDGGRSAT